LELVWACCSEAPLMPARERATRRGEARDEGFCRQVLPPLEPYDLSSARPRRRAKQQLLGYWHCTRCESSSRSETLLSEKEGVNHRNVSRTCRPHFWLVPSMKPPHEREGTSLIILLGRCAFPLSTQQHNVASQKRGSLGLGQDNLSFRSKLFTYNTNGVALMLACKLSQCMVHTVLSRLDHAFPDIR
jgi:hypothetical protein